MEKFAQNATMAESFLLLIPLSYLMWYTVHNWTSESRIQGRDPGGLDPLLFLDQTEAQRAEKIFFGDPPPYQRFWMTVPPPYLKVWMRHCQHSLSAQRAVICT